MIRTQQFIKETFDRIAAVTLLVVTAPVLAVAAALIKLSSRGPVLFAQERIGLHERPFRILKFRTMHVRSAGQPLDNVTVRDDPRVFPAGTWLRKFKIDELPQLINVLRGDMSLVGPRPTVLDDYRRMTREQRRRAVVKPGITGLAQINGAAAIAWPQRIDYDLRYIDQYSLWLDVTILVRTVILVFTGRADANPIEGDEWGDRNDVQLDAGRDGRLAIEGGRPIRSRPYPAWPDFDDEIIEAAAAVLRSGKVNYWTGEETHLFEQEFAKFVGARHAVAVANGTLALELALAALGIGPGDEVVVPSRTFIASASCVVACGAKPVIADIDRQSQNISAETIRSALTPKTKAVIAVHLAGWPCDMDPIMRLAEERGLVVVEDCAQAHGATYKGRPVGSIGHAAAFSFCQDKIMTTGGEGGMLTTNDKAVWRRAWSYKDHGKSWDAVYDNSSNNVFKWLHEGFGSNYRMTEMQAAIGRVMLRRLPAWLAERRRNAALLADGLAGIPGLRTVVPPSDFRHSYYKFYAFLDPRALREDWSRDRVVRALQAEGIPCGSGACGEIYREKAFANAGLAPRQRMPVARELGETSLMFLVHPTLSTSDIQDTVRAAAKVFAAATGHERQISGRAA